MNNFGEFQERATVRALQITRDTTIQEVRQLTRNGNATLEIGSKDGHCFRIPGLRVTTLAFEGDWLVMEGSNKPVTYSDQEFKQKYGAVK